MKYFLFTFIIYLLSFCLTARGQQAQWQCIGPDSIPAIGGDSSGFLSYTQGIGRPSCIRFHPLYDGVKNKTVYVGTPRGGLWTSANGMDGWQEMNTAQLPNMGITDLLFDPADMQHLYIATGDADNGLNPNEAADGTEDTQSRGIYESFDAGHSWSYEPLGTWHNEERQPIKGFWDFPSKKVMRRIYISPLHPEVMGAIIYSYDHQLKKYRSFFYRSDDKGQNWFITFTVNDDSFQDVENKPGYPEVLYISGKNLYKSTDAGATWKQLVSEKFPAASEVLRCKAATCAADPKLLYALFIVGRKAQLFISNDEGSTFELAVNGIGSPAWRTSLAVDPNNPSSVFYSGGNSIYRFSSADGKWKNNNVNENVHADIHELTFAPGGKRLYASSDGGVYMTDSPGTTPGWKYVNNQIGNAMVWRLGTSQRNPNHLIAGLQDCGTLLYTAKPRISPDSLLTTPYSTTWSIIRGGDGAECFFDYTNDSVLYYNDGQNNVFARSDDGGKNWKNITPPGESGDYIKPAVIDPVDHNTIYVGFHNIYKSTDGGTTWKTISDFSAFGKGMSERVAAIAVAPSDPRVIYAAFSQPMWSDELKGKLFRTADGGATWQDVTAGLTGVGYTSITALVVDPHDEDVVYAGFRGGWDFKVMRSETGGRDGSWENYSDDLPKEADVNCIVIDKRKKGALYIGTHYGVYVKKRAYAGWIPFNSGVAGLLPNLRITDLEINYTSSELFAATMGRGVWKTTLPDPAQKKKKRR